MRLKPEWAEHFIGVCAKVRSARRRPVAAGQPIYLRAPEDQCWIVASGYVKLIDPQMEGDRLVRLLLGRGGFFGDRPFRAEAFRGFGSPHREQAIAHGPTEVLELRRVELEIAASGETELARLLIECLTSTAQFLERRLLWQTISPVRARVAAALRDLVCFEGRPCGQGRQIDIRLTHQDLAELLGAARPVISAELVRLRDEELISYASGFFCVTNLDGLKRIADG